jgi:hypothetical protein
MRPLAWGDWAAMEAMPSSPSSRPNWVGSAPPRQLLLAAPGARRVGLEDAVAVVVERQRAARAGDELPQQQEVAVGILDRVEQRRRDRAGRVVDAGQQGELRPAPLQPGVRAAVELPQHPRLRVARPALAGRALPCVLGSVQARRQQDAPHGRARDGDPLPLGQQLAQVLVVAAALGRPRQSHDALPQRGRHGVGRLPPTVAVRHRLGAAPAIPPDQPPDLAHRQPQQRRRRSGCQLPLRHLVQHDDPLPTPLLRHFRPPADANPAG